MRPPLVLLSILAAALVSVVFSLSDQRSRAEQTLSADAAEDAGLASFQSADATLSSGLTSSQSVNVGIDPVTMASVVVVFLVVRAVADGYHEFELARNSLVFLKGQADLTFTRDANQKRLTDVFKIIEFAVKDLETRYQDALISVGIDALKLLPDAVIVQLAEQVTALVGGNRVHPRKSVKELDAAVKAFKFASVKQTHTSNVLPGSGAPVVGKVVSQGTVTSTTTHHTAPKETVVVPGSVKGTSTSTRFRETQTAGVAEAEMENVRHLVEVALRREYDTLYSFTYVPPARGHVAGDGVVLLGAISSGFLTVAKDLRVSPHDLEDVLELIQEEKDDLERDHDAGLKDLQSRTREKELEATQVENDIHWYINSGNALLTTFGRMAPSLVTAAIHSPTNTGNAINSLPGVHISASQQQTTFANHDMSHGQALHLAKGAAAASEYIGVAAAVVNAAASVLFALCGHITANVQLYTQARDLGLEHEGGRTSASKATFATCSAMLSLMKTLEHFLSVDTASVDSSNLWSMVNGPAFATVFEGVGGEAKKQAFNRKLFGRLCDMLSPLYNRIHALFRRTGKCYQEVSKFTISKDSRLARLFESHDDSAMPVLIHPPPATPPPVPPLDDTDIYDVRLIPNTPLDKQRLGAHGYTFLTFQSIDEAEATGGRQRRSLTELNAILDSACAKAIPDVECAAVEGHSRTLAILRKAAAVTHLAATGDAKTRIYLTKDDSSAPPPPPEGRSIKPISDIYIQKLSREGLEESTWQSGPTNAPPELLSAMRSGWYPLRLQDDVGKAPEAAPARVVLGQATPTLAISQEDTAFDFTREELLRSDLNGGRESQASVYGTGKVPILILMARRGGPSPLVDIELHPFEVINRRRLEGLEHLGTQREIESVVHNSANELVGTSSKDLKPIKQEKGALKQTKHWLSSFVYTDARPNFRLHSGPVAKYELLQAEHQLEALYKAADKKQKKGYAIKLLRQTMRYVGIPQEVGPFTDELILRNRGATQLRSIVARFFGFVLGKTAQRAYVSHNFKYSYTTALRPDHTDVMQADKDQWPTTWERIPTSPNDGAPLTTRIINFGGSDAAAEATRPYLWLKRRYVMESLEDLEAKRQPTCIAHHCS